MGMLYISDKKNSAYIQGRRLQIGLQDVAFQPFRASYYTTFLKDCGIGEDIGTVTCPKNVAEISKGMLPVKYLHSNKSSFCVNK